MRSLLGSIRSRVLLVVAVALVPLVGLFAVARDSLTRTTRDQWHEDVRRAAVAGAHVHEEILLQARRTLETMREVEGLPEGRAEACGSVLPELFEEHRWFTALAVVRPDGRTVCVWPDVGPYDLTGRPYFDRAVASGELAFSEHHLGHLTGRPVVTVALPVTDGDTVRSVLAAGVDLGLAAEALSERTPLPSRAEVLLLSDEGDVLSATSDTFARGDRVPGSVLAAAGTALRQGAGPSDAAPPRWRGHTWALAPVRLPTGEPSAWLAVGFSDERLEQTLLAVARPVELGLLLSGLLLLGGAWLVAEVLVVRRVKALVATSERLKSGDFRAHGGQARPPGDELGRLEQTLDDMGESLRALRSVDIARARAAEERLELLSGTVDEVFWIRERASGAFAYVSRAYDRVWGRSPAELETDPDAWLEAVHPDDRDLARERVGRDPQEGVHEYRLQHPTGDVSWIQHHVYVVRDEHGEPVRHLAVAQDVTERKLLEEALLQSSKLEAVGRLAGGVAHDFNNVLTAIRGHTQLLLAEMPAHDPLRPDLEEIDAAAQRGGGLTRQLLMFSRKQPISPRRLDVNAVARDTGAMLRRLVGEDVEVVLELEPDLPAVRADVHQLEQVLLNLSVNARDAMPHGGLLYIGTRRGEVRTARATAGEVLLPGEYVVLDVRDSGTGMPPDVLRRAFEPFFSTKGPGTGTGLGLATVYGVVRQAGGAIEVESEPEQGTRFTIWLPADGGPATGADELEGEPLGTGSERRRGTVLLVEDERAVREVVARTLEQMGWTVVAVASAEEALARASERPARYELLVTDVVMPGMDGVQLLRRLRAQWPDLPAILISGYPGPSLGATLGDRSELDALLLQKPFSRERLEQALAETLRTGSAPAA